MAEAAASRSFDEALFEPSRSTGAEVPKRQAEQLAARAAEDSDAFYEARRAEQGQPPPEGSVVVLTFDGSCASSTSTTNVEVERHLCSVPYQLVREQVEVRYTTNTLEVFHRGKRVASHRRRYDRQSSTVAEHMPSAHRAHPEWSQSRLIRWAGKVGPGVKGGDRSALVARILESRPHPEQGYRPCLGIMQLGRRYGNVRLEAACAARSPTLRSTSRSWLRWPGETAE